MKIAIVDDHQMFSMSLSIALERSLSKTDIKVFGRAHQFLSLNFSEWLPDIVIVDIVMPEMDGLDMINKAVPLMKSQGKFICVSQENDMAKIKNAIRMGVDGFVGKSSDIEELLLAIQTVLDGKQYISREIRDELFNYMLLPNDIKDYNLTPREETVLQGLCEGFTIKEIAANINLSPYTVQLYKSNILRKFDKHRTIDVVSFVLTNGIYKKKSNR